MQDLVKNILKCTKCELHKTAINKVIGEGNLKSKVWFIGEAPGPTEDKEGRPFCGRAGKLLNKWLVHWGLKRENVYITNICRCFPNVDGRIRKPTKTEMMLCAPFLTEMIKINKPKLLVALGATPLEELTGIKSGITKLAGERINSKPEYGGLPVLVILHPAYFIRRGQDGMDLISNVLINTK